MLTVRGELWHKSAVEYNNFGKSKTKSNGGKFSNIFRQFLTQMY